jgi:pimeloyl-ACP methyl ester carboxylesterase
MILWILLVLVLLVCAFVALAYSFYYYEAANDGHIQEVRRRYGSALRSMGRAGVRSLGWMSVIIGCSVLYYLRLLRPSRRTLPREGTPVLLVHGLYHNETAWLMFMRSLREAGLRNLRPYSYNSWSGRLDELTDDLAARLERAYQECGRPVVLLGHSLGGLLIRGCLRRPELSGKILAVATMGTPAEGSKLAVLGPGALAGRIVHRCPQVLEQSGEQAFEVPALALVSDLDDMVLPAASLHANMHAGWRVETVAPVSHITMLFDAGCRRRVAEFFQEQGARPA